MLQKHQDLGFRQKIRHYIVQNFGYTNKEATSIILSGRLNVNGHVVTENILFDESHEIYLDNELLKPKTIYTYIAFYKPRGIETTHSKTKENNLLLHLPMAENLAFAGRLDKESEGLLILSNDGKYVETLSNPKTEKEKEYIVKVNKPIQDDFIVKMGQGVDIVIAQTKPCYVEKISEYKFKIILTEGKNRQIRRMCKAFGYLVEQLIRVRIDKIELEGLKPGKYREFKPYHLES